MLTRLPKPAHLAVQTAVAACCLLANAAQAKPVVTVAHHDNDAATKEYTFKEVSAPRHGAVAKFSLVDGDADPSGGSLELLHDGKLPDEEDQPDANFFLAGDGGRIVADLGKAIQVQEVDTYSWHPHERGPQVYKLYGSNGTAEGFVAGPKQPQDPAQCGWKLLAEVDTRPKGDAEPGGQYAVSIADPDGTALGGYRYLLFDVSKCDESDYGNTFYSEIVVIDHDVPAGAPPARTPTVKGIVIEHHGNPSATGKFEFENIAPPRLSAAIDAKFSLVDGGADLFGSDLDVLHDGKLPDEEDQPDANFFLAGDGGRIVADLGKAIQVQEVDTYSWHPHERGPQVYKLYGSNGTAEGFVAGPKQPQDPAQCGWKLLAEVDTRPKDGAEPGGQYAVGIAGPDGTDLGEFRYLLFDVSKSDESANGNTFYSEIVILDRAVPTTGLCVPQPPNPAGRTTLSVVELGADGLTLRVISSDPPAQVDGIAKWDIAQLFLPVYQKMVEAFNPDAPKTAELKLSSSPRHPQFLDPQNVTGIVRELAHQVQGYVGTDYQKGGKNYWLSEGIAAYLQTRSWTEDEQDGTKLPAYDPAQKHDSNPEVTARFLIWLENHGQASLVQKLDRAIRDNAYTPDTWQKIAGKTVEQLWQDYTKDPALGKAATTASVPKSSTRGDASRKTSTADSSGLDLRRLVARLKLDTAQQPDGKLTWDAAVARGWLRDNGMKAEQVAAMSDDQVKRVITEVGGDIFAPPLPPSEFPADWTSDSKNQRAKHAALEGKPMPALALSGWINGEVKPENMRGKVVLVDLYATWCGPCMAAIPHNNELLKNYKDKGLIVIGVCTSGSGQQSFAQNAKEHNIQYPAACDPQSKTEQAWKVAYYPTYTVVDRKGVVRVVGLNPDKVEEVVKKLLAEPAS